MKNHILFQIAVIIGSLLSHSTTKSMSHHEDSQDTTRNDAQAFVYFSERAQFGETEALIVLGYFYKNGIGTQKNISKARECYEIAAHDRNTMAMFYLGQTYENDEPINYGKAKSWFIKTIRYGEPTMKAIAQTALVRVENKIRNIHSM